MKTKRNKFKHNLILATLGTLATASYAQGNRHIDYAEVIDISPVYHTFEHRIPQRDCWPERVRIEPSHKQRSSATPAIVGGIIGGAIGNAVGHSKTNKKVGTVVGSILGLSVGNDIGRRQQRNSGYSGGHTGVSYKQIERCEVNHIIERKEKLVGYDVSYNYHGQTYTTRMDQHPGKRIKVSVNVSPVEY